MTGVISSLAPVFGLIVAGYLLKTMGPFGQAFWEGAERLTFYILFPALLVTSIARAKVGGMAMLPMAAALAAATLILAGVLAWARPSLEKGGLSGPAFAALFQGAIRPNTYVGIAVLVALYGKAGLPLAAIAIVAVIPLVNFLGIVAHLRWARPPAAGRPAANPGWGEAVVPALPIGLMAVGAGLDLAAARDARAPVTMAIVLKLVVMPLAVDAACRAFGVADVTRAAADIFAALPVSATAYVVSAQMGGDARLMAGIVAASTVAAAVTLPVVVFLVG